MTPSRAATSWPGAAAAEPSPPACIKTCAIATNVKHRVWYIISKSMAKPVFAKAPLGYLAPPCVRPACGDHSNLGPTAHISQWNSLPSIP